MEAFGNNCGVRKRNLIEKKVLFKNNDIKVEHDVETTELIKPDSDNILTKEILEEEKTLEKKIMLGEKEMRQKIIVEQEKEAEEMCFKRLKLLLSRSSIYAKFMAEKLEKRATIQNRKSQKRKLQSSSPEKKCDVSSSENIRVIKRKASASAASPKKLNSTKTVVDVYKNKKMASIEFKDPQLEILSENATNVTSTDLRERHPDLFTGGQMRPYQIEGFEWLKVLYENGVNGVLADEMGLGKTIQCIAFISYLIEMGVPGPFFVCAPLTTLPNWFSEFNRFTPKIPVLLYHGHKDARPDLYAKIRQKVKVNNFLSCFPVVITSYSMALIDAKKLSKIAWKMLLIDEAHRIKNYECQLVKCLKQYNAVHRLLLTGTPLQNDLTELWSLLNFIIPEIFDDLKVFQSWFDISKLTQSGATKEIIAKEQEKQIVSTIHQILTPFLLRRTKVDVQLDLPPKKEIVVYAPLTNIQKKYYAGVLNRTIANTLKAETLFFDPKEILGKRKSKKTEFLGCENENIDFSKINVVTELDTSTIKSEVNQTFKTDSSHFMEDFDIALSSAKVTLKMQHTMMILRHICNHPFLITYPDHIDEHIVKTSGKLLVLDAMLPELKKRGHKVIIFSQFVMMLGILEDYCNLRKYKYTCLYGKMNLDERRVELEEYKNESTFIFLISTKAGGLGINIISADTVIIYDSDWNPQNDLQAQDRCHRIGQTKPVVVYRLIVPNTIDERILNRAGSKRKLEKAIIQQGRFTSTDITKSQNMSISPEDLLELLESSDNCGFVETDDKCVLSPEELDKILDRSNMK